jgi:hypothetical protein
VYGRIIKLGSNPTGFYSLATHDIFCLKLYAKKVHLFTYRSPHSRIFPAYTRFTALVPVPP